MGSQYRHVVHTKLHRLIDDEIVTVILMPTYYSRGVIPYHAYHAVLIPIESDVVFTGLGR